MRARPGRGVRGSLLLLLLALWPVGAAPPPGEVENAAAELRALLEGLPSGAGSAGWVHWVLRHNHLFTIEVAGPGGFPFRYSHPVLEPFHRAAPLIDWDEAWAGIPPADRFALYRGRATGGEPRRPADLVPLRVLLREDILQYGLSYLVHHASGGRYDGAERRIVYSDPTLRDVVSYFWMFAREDASGLAGYLARIRGTSLYEALVCDTLTEVPASRSEPFDHLGLGLKEQLQGWLHGIQADPRMSGMSLGRFCRQVTDAVLGAPRDRSPPPPLVIGHNRDPHTRRFTYLCLGPARDHCIEEWEDGGSRTILQGVGRGSVPGEHIERAVLFTLPDPRVLYGQIDLRAAAEKQDVAWRITGGQQTYSVSFTVEQGQGTLPQPDGIRLARATETGELNAVVSFALVPSLSERNVGRFLEAIYAFGFALQEPSTPVADLMGDFLREAAAPNTGLLVPIYHVVDQELYRLGWQGARKVVLTKELPGAGTPRRVDRVRAVFYFPPPVETGEEVLLDREAFGQVFERRLAGSLEPDTLTIMNMACDSQYTVESWMAAFREAVVDRAPGALDPGDVPFLLGARRGFDAEQPAAFLTHPLLVSRDLIRGCTRSEILRHLGEGGKRAYHPASNYGRPALFEMGGNFRVHVVNVDHPEEKATY